MIDVNFLNNFNISECKTPEIVYQSICNNIIFAKINSSFDSVMQLLGLIILFFLVLVGSVLVTRWIGLNGMSLNQSKNITIIETYSIAQNKCIQIVQIADKYVAIAVSKDSIEFITEIDKESIDFDTKNKSMRMTKMSELLNFGKRKSEEKNKKSFKEILEKMSKGNNDKHE